MDDELLVSEVKQHPCLNNTRTSDFRVQLKKKNAWKAVCTALDVTGKGLCITKFTVHTS